MREYNGMTDVKRLEIIEEYLHTSGSKTKFLKERGIKWKAVSRWMSTFAIEKTQATVTPMDNNNVNKADLSEADEIARLKQELRDKDLELRKSNMLRDAYEKMIELAEEKYAIPIRKNSGAK